MTELIFNKNEAAAKAKKRAALRREIVGTLMILAPLVCFIAFTLFPMLISLIVSFNDLHSYNMKYMEFVGWDNYKKIFAIGEFSDIVTPLSLWDSIKNTLLFSLCVPINLISAVFLANIISKKMPGNKFMRVILFMPQICSGVAVTLMWQWIFEDSFGVINTMLAAVGLNKVHWLTLPSPFTCAVLIISLWQHGTNVIILESAFLNVNQSTQEAARIDGANEFQVFWKVTFPALTPSIFYLLVMWTIAALQEQTVMQIITTNGVGPGNRAVTLVYYIYRLAFTYTSTWGMGIACALSWITAIFIILINRLLFASGKLWVKYDE